MPIRFRFSALFVVASTLSVSVLTAQSLPVSKQARTLSPASPVLSSVNDAGVPAASGLPQPCVVNLFTNYVFQSYSAQYFQYAPSCPGPWSKVLFKGNFNVSEGIQYDRTANIQLGYVNIYFGTTEEPSPTSAPSWNVERDLTDYTSLFTTAQSGEVDIYNIVNSTYTGIIYGTATLEFYPVASGDQPPLTADAIYPLPDGPGAPVQLPTGASQLAATFSLPTNIQAAYLDVISQGQQGDEFWYTCVPNDVSAELEECGSTPFRETEISIDGQPAGVAPIYPWIFTGGIDPYLWIPIPGLQTLNFKPYRVNLTPFAAILSNGQPHTVAVSVFNANNYFQDTASLLVYLDHGSTQVTGATTVNTLTLPSPNTVENLVTGPNGGVLGTVTVTSGHNFTISGYVNTSRGMVTTTIDETLNFVNAQKFNINASEYIQDIAQNTTGTTQVTTTNSDGASTYTDSFHYPFAFDFAETLNSQGIQLLSTVSQGYLNNDEAHVFEETVQSTDTLQLDPTGSYIVGNSNQKSAHEVTDSANGKCANLLVTAANNLYAGTQASLGCN